MKGTDWTQVRWTASDPADFKVVDPVERRRRRMRRLLSEANRQGADPRIEDVAAALGVSVATVRRDLSVLRHSDFGLTTRGSR